jgi:hypothetical protein
MANTLIQLKYSEANSNPSLLNVAEPAYSYVSNTLFIGTANNDGYLVVGGQGGFISLAGSIKGGQNAIKKSHKMMWEDNSEKYRDNTSKRVILMWQDPIIKCKMLNRRDWTDREHSEDTKKLMSEQRKGAGIGEANSQYGTCWITKDGLNKKIKKEDLESHIIEGWVKGRK